MLNTVFEPAPSPLKQPSTPANRLVSIVIPCYNGERYVAEAIDSILAQTYQHFEIIVVDNGSEDDTRGVVTRYPQVRYIRQPNQGGSAARNRGLIESRGDYVIFLDHDDRLQPNTLELGVNYLDTEPECAFVFGFYRLINEHGHVMEKQDQHRPIEQADYRAVLSGRIQVPPGTCMFRRSKIASIGGFNPALWPTEDYDVYLRLARSYPIHCHNQVVLDYRRHESNQSTQMGRLRNLQQLWCRLDEQKSFCDRNPAYRTAYEAGKRYWLKILGPTLPYEMAAHIKSKQWFQAASILWFITRNYPQALVKYIKETLAKFSGKRSLPTSPSAST